MSDMKDIGAGAQMIERPLVIMFQTDDMKTLCHLHPPFDWSHKHYGILICDLVRHVAAMFHCTEDKVWYWVDKERRNPTDKSETIRDAFPRPQ
jgi:hypothetical protein